MPWASIPLTDIMPGMKMPDRLPIDESLQAVLAAIAEGQPVILRAPPGAGKTTGVPPALIDSDALLEGKILLLQPRRIAARAAAHRLSQLAGEPIGSTYGYHVRFDRKQSAQTRVVAMTTGILLRRLTGDPLLEDVSCVILDEFHERSLEMDLALGMLQRIRTTLRPELRIIVMSATLDTLPVEALIEDAVTIESLGRAFDVDVRYEESYSRERGSRTAEIAAKVSDRIADALESNDGDLLVFLPGVGEIHQTADLITGIAAEQDLKVCKLYGDLSPTDQDAVLEESDHRKIVLATNIAETSITIPGITCVIDSGLARVLQHDTSVGIPCLRLEPISKASADQRAGRAGRTAPGVCFRLWPAALHRSRPDHYTRRKSPAPIFRLRSSRWPPGANAKSWRSPGSRRQPITPSMLPGSCWFSLAPLTTRPNGDRVGFADESSSAASAVRRD